MDSEQVAAGQGIRQLPVAVQRLVRAQGETEGSATQEPAGAAADQSPIFILCAARSGSTLTRVLLNSHHAVACPPETNLPQAARALLHMWTSTEAGGDWQALSAEARTQVVSAVSAPLRRFAHSRGKQRWCDKSAANVPGADLLVDLFPNARFVCLYRHPMDLIASGLTAAKWGFSAFGFEPYVRMSADNLVRALALYWYDQAIGIRRFEKRHPQRCARVYYEALVSAPEVTCRTMCDRLGIAWDPQMLRPDFAAVADFGPGDFKLPYRRSIEADSIGRGITVPVAMVPPELLLVMNALLAELRYPEIGTDWNIERHPLVPDPSGRPGSGDDVAEALAVLRRGVAGAAVADGVARAVGGGHADGEAPPLLRLNLEGAPPLVIDPGAGVIRAEAGGDRPAAVVATSPGSLLAVAAGRNMGEAVRAADVRIMGCNQTMAEPQRYLVARYLAETLTAGGRPAGRADEMVADAGGRGR